MKVADKIVKVATFVFEHERKRAKTMAWLTVITWNFSIVVLLC
jgi:hypothetical protein